MMKKINSKGNRYLYPLSLVSLCTSLLVLAGLAVLPRFTSADSQPTNPYVTLLFSRTEMSAADNCVENDTNIATLDGQVAPYLQALGMTGTGTLVTGKTQDTTRLCTHYNESLGASWTDASNLANTYGWSFVSHTATYPGPAKMSQLTPTQAWNQTCGSAQTITAHGLPGANGMIAYPGAQAPPTTLQTQYGANCFAWGRHYGKQGLTTVSAATTSPYWQYTEAVQGGPCNDSTQPCYTPPAPVPGTKRYTLPSTIMSEIDALKPGQWLSLQAYVLVSGSNPDDITGVNQYTSNQTEWDCNSPDPAEHWTNDVERYCYSDYQQIVSEISAYNANAAINGTAPIIVTDPMTVGIAFGRPATYSYAKP